MADKLHPSESKFVGVWLSQQTNSFLSLYALSKRISKSEVIRRILKGWEEEIVDWKAIQELISDVTARLQQEWKDKKRLYSITDPNRFTIHKEDLEIRLRRKGLEKEHIKLILEGLTQ